MHGAKESSRYFIYEDSQETVFMTDNLSFLSELLHHICKGIASASISIPVVTKYVASC